MAKKDDLKPEDILQSITAAISVRVLNPQYSSQAKEYLSGKDVYDAIYSACVRELRKLVKDLSEKDKQAIIAKIKENQQVRQAADIAKITKRKSVKKKSQINLPSKLKDCRLAGTKDSDKCELYVAEGASAASTLCDARNGAYQAVLPIRGKILNVLKLDLTKKNDLKKFNANAEIADIIKSLGCGIGAHCDINESRYGKVIIASDNDRDGDAIAVLITGLFFTLFQPLVKTGMLYRIVSPLFEIIYNENGKECIELAANDVELIPILKRLDKKHIKYKLNRNKGLGELNSDFFSKYVLMPDNRVLEQITMEDAQKAKDMLELAIGNIPTDERKQYMLDNYDWATKALAEQGE